MNATTTNLFGDRVAIRARGYVEPRGYAGQPGAGPAGETCSTCEHARQGRRWAKCIKGKRRTNGRGTDILLRAPACQHWGKGE